MSAAPAVRRRPTRAFRALRTASEVHAAVYVALLVVWILPGLAGPTSVLGLSHGLIWIALSLATLIACQRRLVRWDVFAFVAVLAAVLPLAGAYGYVREERRIRRLAR